LDTGALIFFSVEIFTFSCLTAPSMRLYVRNIIFLTSALFFLCTALTAQVRQHDYGKRATGFESQKFSTPMKQFSVNESTMSKRFSTPDFSMDMSKLDQRESRFRRSEAMPLQRYRANELSFDEMTIEKHRFADREPSMANLERVRFNTLHHRFNERHSHLLEREQKVFEDQLDGLSMADVNRYHFRRSHSQDPGLPVTEAAGGRSDDPSGKNDGRTIVVESN